MPILCSIEPQDTPLRAPSEPSALTSTFGTTNSDTPLMPAGAPSMRASTRWMMFSVEIVLAGRDEDLGARDLVAAVGLLDRLGAQQAEIRAALRLGEVHGAGPFARHHLRHEHLLLFGLAVHHQRRGRAHGQAAIHRKRHVGRALEFGDDLAQRHRQALPAIFRRRRQAEPAAFGDLLEGFLETLRRRHRAVVIAACSLRDRRRG